MFIKFQALFELKNENGEDRYYSANGVAEDLLSLTCEGFFTIEKLVTLAKLGCFKVEVFTKDNPTGWEIKATTKKAKL